MVWILLVQIVVVLFNPHKARTLIKWFVGGWIVLLLITN